MKKYLPLFSVIIVALALLLAGSFTYFKSSQALKAGAFDYSSVRIELIRGLENGTINKSGKEFIPLLKSVNKDIENKNRFIKNLNQSINAMGMFMVGLGVFLFIGVFELKSNLSKNNTNKTN